MLPKRNPAGSLGTDFTELLAEIFRGTGWKVRRNASAGDRRADMIVHKARHTYVVAAKAAAEGRRDRLIPLLSQAVLEAQSLARLFPGNAAPLAVVGARQVSPGLADQIRSFAEHHAPGVALGIVDADGWRLFVGPGLQGLDTERGSVRQRVVSPRYVPHLFSDLNQWMLKILIGQILPESLLSVPRARIRNASQLAKAATVSIMSASRLVHQLVGEGFLEENGEALEIVRHEELLELWVAANRQTWRDLPVRFIVKQDEKQFFAAVARYAAAAGQASEMFPSRRRAAVVKSRPRCCLGLFTAADVLGYGFVRGVSPLLYLERLDLEALRQLGLSLEDADRRADVLIRVPSNREAIFRAVVLRAGLPVSDLLQVWIDVSAHPSRGREQAHEIWRRVLKPLLGSLS